MNGFGRGVAFAVVTTVVWGGQFVVAKGALDTLDAFWLTTVRYALAAALLLALLAALEGPRALRLDGRALRLAGLGTLGFAGFNLFGFTGLAHAEPQSAALVVALAPLVTATVLWLRDGVRPPRVTAVAMAAALLGVALVISRGDLGSFADGSVGWGDGLVLVGVVCFVVYTLGAAGHPELSALRYTALTAGLGWIAIAAATAAATAAGLVDAPAAGDVLAVSPELLYLALPGAVLAVVTWNAAVGRIGAQNVALIGNLIPVVTFAIQVVRGYRPVALELAGAALTVGALAANNLLLRRRARAAEAQDEPEELLEAA